MKHTLNIILLALRFIIVFVGGTGVLHFIVLYLSLANSEERPYLILNYFKPLAGIADMWAEPLFLGLFGVLLAYLVFILVKLYKSLDNLQKGNIFYPDQSKEFKAAGSGIVIFAKCKYLLFCSFGALPFHDLGTFAKEIPSLLIVYLLGKFVLVLYYMAEKGEYLREENDLTL